MTGPSRLVADGPPDESQAERRHRTLTELKRTVTRHPAVDVAAGVRTDEGRFRELNVALDPLILGIDASDTLGRDSAKPWSYRTRVSRPDTAAQVSWHVTESRPSVGTGLRIEWRPRPDPAEPAYFVCHYYDSAGRDFGWHREPNPHVDGLAHYQERRGSGGKYDYRTASFDVDSPIELLWTVLGRIEERLSTNRE